MDASKAIGEGAAADGAGGWSQARAAGLSFRPVREGDRPFLATLYASTREEELARTGWTGPQKQAFLEQQFGAQDQHYRRHYVGAEFLVVERAGEPVGRLYLARWPREHRIVDIAFVPAARGVGFGSALLRDLVAEAHGLGRSLSIHVERMNRALSLYERLGFRLVEDKGVYLLLEVAREAQRPSSARLR